MIKYFRLCVFREIYVTLQDISVIIIDNKTLI